MLIKSTRDSGICVGVWEGLREAKAQTKTDPVLPSTPGTDEGGGLGCCMEINDFVTSL